MLNFKDLNSEDLYTQYHLNYCFQLVAKDEEPKNDGTNLFFKSATFKAVNASPSFMEAVKGIRYTVTFYEDDATGDYVTTTIKKAT